MRYLRSFLVFWYDFLVGDRPELFVGVIVALVVARLVVLAGQPGLAGLVIVVAAFLILGFSLGRAIAHRAG